MEEALRFYSWKGFCAEMVAATAIKGLSDARQKGPFVDESRKPVLWVNWGTRQSGKWARPYFRHWPKSGTGPRAFATFPEHLAKTKKQKGESDVHKKAKEVCVQLLQRKLASGERLPWAFQDESCSDFALTGDLLSEVEDIIDEHPVQTPFDAAYQFDVALLGQPIREKRLILGAIEFELEHRFDIWKTAVCKAMGFPLIAINLEGVALDEITEDWCLRMLTETTQTSDDGQRRNYFYVHTMLYPVFLNIPQKIQSERRHQYLVFASDADLKAIARWLGSLKKLVGLPDGAVLLQPQRASNPQTLKSTAHEGSMAGHDWRDYNATSYLRIVMDVPCSKSGPLYRFHLGMAHLLNCHCESLVGFKYQNGITNDEPENPLWTHRHWTGETFVLQRVAPKHLSQPIRPLRTYLQALDGEAVAL